MKMHLDQYMSVYTIWILTKNVWNAQVNTAYEAGLILSVVDPRIGEYPSECLKPLLDLALSCVKDNTESRPSMAEVVRGLEAIWQMTPRSDIMRTADREADYHENSTPSSNTNPYISSDIDGSGLMSGTILHVAPR
jgi:hypothetical protein